ncbi:MarR family winged helix-turn-helix transcriptional regulator [Angustibacter aerolatus]
MTDVDEPVRRMLDQWAVERPDLDVAPMAVLGRLGRAGALVERAIAATLSRHGVNRGEYDVLATLRRSGAPYALTPSRLAEAVLLSPAAMTNRIDRLRDLGLVRRQRNPADGRGWFVELTPDGRRVVDEATDDHVRTLHEVLAPLGPRQRTQLSRLLVVLAQGLVAGGTRDGDGRA